MTYLRDLRLWNIRPDFALAIATIVGPRPDFRPTALGKRRFGNVSVEKQLRRSNMTLAEKQYRRAHLRSINGQV